MIQDSVVLILPMIIDVVNRFAKTTRQKEWIAYLVSGIIGILVNATLVQTIFLHFSTFSAPVLFSGLQLIAHVVLVILGTQGVYLKYWENTGIHNSIVPDNTKTVTTNPAAGQQIAG